MWPFKKKRYVAPWWNGYIRFPEGVDELSILVGNSRIVLINNKEHTVSVYEYGPTTYINKRLMVIEL